MGRPASNIGGKRFGKLLVLHRMNKENLKHKDAWWSCVCECGTFVERRAGNLIAQEKKGFNNSCGCLKRVGTQLRHGHQRKSRTTRTYKTWASMKARCLNPKETVWEYYGGRGIQVCKRWMEFDNFLTDMGLRPGKEKEFTLDRIDVEGDYTPSNCKWATPLQQRHNQRRP